MSLADCEVRVPVYDRFGCPVSVIVTYDNDAGQVVCRVTEENGKEESRLNHRFSLAEIGYCPERKTPCTNES